MFDTLHSIVGEKNVVCDIKESSLYDYPFRDLGEHRTYFRKRKIPRSKKKNYPVKPITPVQQDKHWKLLERSEMASQLSTIVRDNFPRKEMY